MIIRSKWDNAFKAFNSESGACKAQGMITIYVIVILIITNNIFTSKHFDPMSSEMSLASISIHLNPPVL